MKNYKAKKRFGQNFLQDAGIINQIVTAIRPEERQTVVEIGPGQGAITQLLLQSGCDLNVIEIDRDLAAHLSVKYEDFPRFHLYEQDVLTFDFSRHFKGQKIRVVGNLPYNISTPILFHLLDSKTLIEDMHFMLQKEVVDRMAAEPGSKQYGRLSVMLQVTCQVEPLIFVPPTAFDPVPKVDSMVVRLKPYDTPFYAVNDMVHFSKVVKAAFSQRRKTIRNTLKGILTESEIIRAGIRPDFRAEALSVADFVNLANLENDQ